MSDRNHIQATITCYPKIRRLRYFVVKDESDEPDPVSAQQANCYEDGWPGVVEALQATHPPAR